MRSTLMGGYLTYNRSIVNYNQIPTINVRFKVLLYLRYGKWKCRRFVVFHKKRWKVVPLFMFHSNHLFFMVLGFIITFLRRWWSSILGSKDIQWFTTRIAVCTPKTLKVDVSAPFHLNILLLQYDLQRQTCIYRDNVIPRKKSRNFLINKYTSFHFSHI